MEINMTFAFLLNLSLTLSIAFLLVAILLSLILRAREFYTVGDRLHKRHTMLTPLQLFVIFFFVGSLFLFLPVYYTEYLAGEPIVTRIIKTVFLSLTETMKMFLGDADFDIINSALYREGVGLGVLADIFSAYASAVFILGPLTTLGFVLSFFKSLSSYVTYLFSLKREIYYISEISEKSLALAENVRRKHRRALIVFFEVVGEESERHLELIDRARMLGALTFKKDITEIGLKPLSGRIKRRFYFLGENEEENIKEALTLVNHTVKSRIYNTPLTEFYVFATSRESEALLDAANNGRMKLRRINESRSVAYRTILESRIYERAHITADGIKRVNAVIVGLGKSGGELLRALLWTSQLPRYELTVNIFDQRENVKDELVAECPELFKNNGKRIEGEAYYKINIHAGVDVRSAAFSEKLSRLGRVTAIFNSLGNDTDNIEAALFESAYYHRRGADDKREAPLIFALVYSDARTETALGGEGLSCFDKTPYGITLIGALSKRYDPDVIEALDYERRGLEAHLSWINMKKRQLLEKGLSTSEVDKELNEETASYYKYEYFRRSSVATVIHSDLLESLGVTYESDEERRINEHRRWCAYMRCEGYSLHDKVKSHIARLHTDLKPFYEIDKNKREYDDVSLAARTKNENK